MGTVNCYRTNRRGLVDCQDRNVVVRDGGRQIPVAQHLSRRHAAHAGAFTAAKTAPAASMAAPAMREPQRRWQLPGGPAGSRG